MTRDMTRGWTMLFVMLTALALAAAPLGAQPQADAPQADTPPTEAPAAPAPAQPAARPLTVAVLDFDAGDVAIDGLGGIVGQTITVMLAGEPGFQMVDRASLAQTLQEHELNLTGLVDTNQAVRVGQLVGARLLVTGRVFQLGQRTFITAKIIGTETTLVAGVLVQGEAGAAIDELVIEVAQRIGERVAEEGPRLVAQDAPLDPLPALREALAGRQLPRVAVVIPEEHIAARRVTQPVPDPAAETEVKRLLQSAGIVVQDVPQNALAGWAQATRRGQRPPWPQELAGVDLVVTGEAFSEFAARIGNLQSAAARVEINVIDRRTGEIILAERATTRAVDLAENIAGKTALEKGGRTVAIELLRHLADNLPQAEADDAAPDAEVAANAPE